MNRTALLDSDIIAYAATSAEELRLDWDEDGDVTQHADFDKAVSMAEKKVQELADAVKADRVVICLSDPKANFRKQVLASYKSNRANTLRPLLLQQVKDYLAKEYPSFVRPTLEADDIMGILATHDHLIKGEKVIVSEDKDMRTVPALLYNPNRPQLGIIEVSPLDADRFHLWQTIVGDQTDGYSGAKGVGKSSVYAEEIIGADRDEMWDIVLEAYASVGLKESDAITQAQLARILRTSEYDFTTKKPRLWCPTFIHHFS